MVTVSMLSTERALPLPVVVPPLTSGTWNPGEYEGVCLTLAALDSIPDVHETAMTVLLRDGGISLNNGFLNALMKGTSFRSLSGNRVRGLVNGSYTIHTSIPISLGPASPLGQRNSCISASLGVGHQVSFNQASKQTEPLPHSRKLIELESLGK